MYAFRNTSKIYKNFLAIWSYDEARCSSMLPTDLADESSFVSSASYVYFHCHLLRCFSRIIRHHLAYINYAPFTSFQRLFNDVSIHTNAILYSCILCILQSNQKIKITTHRSVTISLFLSRRFFTFSDIKSRFRRSSCKSFTSSSVTSSLFLQ